MNKGNAAHEHWYKLVN